MAQNSPQSSSQSMFGSSHTHPVIGINHPIGGHWVMGLSANYRFFQERDTGHHLPILSLNHEALFSIRVYDPVYFLTGPKIHYLFPAKAGNIPPERVKRWDSEIGAGWSAMILVKIDDEVFVDVRIDRWRGTETSRLQGIEMAMGAGYLMPW